MSRKLLTVLFIVVAVVAATGATTTKAATNVTKPGSIAPGKTCTNTSDCTEFYICSESSGKFTCTHKSIFPDPAPREQGGLVLAVVTNALVNAAGIGGGALFVPYLTLLNNYTPSQAVSFTYPLVFSGGLGCVLSTIIKRHPETNRPLVNYNIITLCIPMLLSAVPIGVVLKKAMAGLMINMFVFAVILFSLIKTFTNYIRHRKKEKQMFAREKAEKEAKAKGLVQTEEELKSAPANIENTPGPEGAHLIHLQPEKVASQNGELERLREDKDEADKDVIKVDIELEKIDPRIESDKERKELAESRKIVEKLDSAASLQNNIPRHAGDTSYVNDDEIPFGIPLIIFNDPEKVIAQARENERRLEAERMKITHERRKAEELKRTAEALASGKNTEDIALEKFKEEEKRKKIIQELEKYEHRLIHWEKVLILVLSLVIIFVLNIIAGNGNYKSVVGIAFCSHTYWGMSVLQILLEWCVFGLAVFLVLRVQRKKDSVDWVWRPEDMRFTPKKLIAIFCVGIIAGTLGGVIAIGGAMIFAPVMLEFGMPPQPLSATVVWFHVITQFTTMILSILLGNYTGREIAFLICTPLCCSFVASKTIHWIVKKTRRQSLILLNLMIVVFISFAVEIASTVVNMENVNRSYMLTFNPVCPTS